MWASDGFRCRASSSTQAAIQMTVNGSVLWLGDPWASAAQPKVGKALEKLRRKHKNSFKIIYPVVLVINQESVSGITIFSEGGLPALSLLGCCRDSRPTLCVPSFHGKEIVPCCGDRIGNIFPANNELRHICKHPRGILCSHIAVARLGIRAFACIRLRQTILSFFRNCIGADVHSCAQGHLRKTCGP